MFKFKPKKNIKLTKKTFHPKLDLNLNTIVVEPSVVGDNEFTIVVENAQKKIQKKSLRIKMVDSSLASITRFEADPVTGEAGNYATVIHWVTLNADRVELLVNGKALWKSKIAWMDYLKFSTLTPLSPFYGNPNWTRFSV